jgi:hypothetical protein
MAATLGAAIPPHKSSSVPSDLASIKLKQEFQGGTSKDKKCSIFNGGDPMALKPYSMLRRDSGRSILMHSSMDYRSRIHSMDSKKF